MHVQGLLLDTLQLAKIWNGHMVSTRVRRFVDLQAQKAVVKVEDLPDPSLRTLVACMFTAVRDHLSVKTPLSQGWKKFKADLEDKHGECWWPEASDEAMQCEETGACPHFELTL